eukprot:Skav210929  [mRNA]  locus=scaffold978:397446:402360:- [translate_table: standard]
MATPRHICCCFAATWLRLGCCFASYIFATVFIHFYITDFAIMGIQMANFGGTERGLASRDHNTTVLLIAYSKITINLLAIIFIILVDLILASELLRSCAAQPAAAEAHRQVVLSGESLEKELSRVESLGREASQEPRYHRIEPR